MVRLESKHANSIILKFPVKNVIPVALGWGKKKKKKERKKEKHFCQTKSSLDSRMSSFNFQLSNFWSYFKSLFFCIL